MEDNIRYHGHPPNALTPEQAAPRERGERPLFLLAAEERARAEGISVAELFERYAQRLSITDYPTGDCVTPDEIQELCDTGSLPAERLKHLDTCDGCVALWAASMPSEKGVEHFLEQVRTTLAGTLPHLGHKQSLHSISQQHEPVAHTPQSARVTGWIRPALATAAGLLLGIVATFGAFRLAGDRSSSSLPPQLAVIDSSGSSSRLESEIRELRTLLAALHKQGEQELALLAQSAAINAESDSMMRQELRPVSQELRELHATLAEVRSSSALQSQLAEGYERELPRLAASLNAAQLELTTRMIKFESALTDMKELVILGGNVSAQLASGKPVKKGDLIHFFPLFTGGQKSTVFDASGFGGGTNTWIVDDPTPINEAGEQVNRVYRSLGLMPTVTSR